jgi:hypothetical protein
MLINKSHDPIKGKLYCVNWEEPLERTTPMEPGEAKGDHRYDVDTLAQVVAIPK